ncbi:hypothetical protein TNIN_353391 [Trichonephila inaurata madagascariensis]|uniref:Uncharacterized protein n=1 Tax=Trichonephila inaurata madagascariensis TaxID=2747483 RepID=A0A8X7BYN5_9ARAC|nr:hypothetical protein TNIN_353391 [Trichonephila inaurata madagascariensis]
MLNSSLTSIENLLNNFANIKEEAIGLAKKMGHHPRSLKKRDRKVRQFFDDFNADEKLQDRERLFEVDVFKANVDVITTQLKNRFVGMNGIYKSFSFLSPKNIVSTTNDLLYNEASNLQKVYSLDLSSEFPNQIMSLKAVFSEDLIKLNSIKDLASSVCREQPNELVTFVVQPERDVIKETVDKFTLNELVKICDVLSIDSEGTQLEIAKNIVTCLCDFEILKDSLTTEEILEETDGLSKCDQSVQYENKSCDDNVFKIDNSVNSINNKYEQK